MGAVGGRPQYDYDWSACNREIDPLSRSPTHDSTALVYAGLRGWRSAEMRTAPADPERSFFDPLNPDCIRLRGVLSYEGDYEVRNVHTQEA